MALNMLELHEKYESVVRVAPNELAFADSSAWKDIMGHRSGQQENSKWQPFSRIMESSPTDIISAEREEHSRLRRQLSHGVSDKSI